MAVVGFKAAGKTRVVEALVAELTKRSRRVGTIKHTAEDAPLDSSGTDTSRHVQAGAVSSAIISGNRSALFLERAMDLAEAAASLGSVDYIVLEGFKTLDLCPRIIVPRKPEELKELSNGLEVAIVNIAGTVKGRGDLPVLGLDDAAKLADIVESKAFPLLAGLDCGGCGHASCRELGLAILKGEAAAESCIEYATGVSLSVNGVRVPLKPFVEDTVRNVVYGLVKSLKGVGDARTIEIEVRRND